MSALALIGSPSPHVVRIVPISLGLTVLLGAGALIFPNAGQGLFHRWEQAVSGFAERKSLAVIIVFLSVIALRLAVLPLLPVPVPGIHDEYSYLLAGDTFAHGRLTNPSHPMWISFETFQVNSFPTYASKYPPAQGFAIAFGDLLGHPWIGILLSDAGMCVAILWMLQGWLPGRWAFLGGALVALKFGVASYWMNTYWGGAMAAIGGALVLGALPRITRHQHPKIRDAIILGLGIAILANSRPYEGFLFCLPAAAWFCWWLIGKTKSSQPVSLRVLKALAPLTIVLVLTATFMGYYNWRVTGNMLLMPYMVNERTYRTAGLFLWDHEQPEKRYRNQQFEDLYNGYERTYYNNSTRSALRISLEKLRYAVITYFWIGGLLALPAIPFLFRDRKMRLLAVTFFVVAAGVFVVVASNPHYAAPLTCVCFALAVQAIRHLRVMRLRGRPVGLALSRAIVLLLALDTATYAGLRRCSSLPGLCTSNPSRAAIVEKLQQTPGRHLVVVRYQRGHDVHQEWVYNGAEIDAAKVIWARELDHKQNSALIAYFSDRNIWLVAPDTGNIALEPYPTSPTASHSPN